MKEACILCDFDGTITEKDGLYTFFSLFAPNSWIKIEKLWEENKIDSKECLLREFQCIENLNKSLIDNYLKTVKIDNYFKEFQIIAYKKGYDIIIVSDGVDYFINKILENNKIKDIKIISNHFEIEDNKFELTFPFCSTTCKKNAGTCKCEIANEMKKQYEKIIYIGDGMSDYCVCDKADILYAKNSLIDFCEKNNISCKKFNTFKDIIKQFIH